MKVTLIHKREAGLGICAFELADPAGAPLPPFTAGAHIDVHLPHGLVRQYSLCNAPGERHRYVLGVLREPASRGGSAAMHALAEGGELEISAPRNHFPLAEAARHSVLLAGGIGITPILAMAESLVAAGASFDLHYCVREPARVAFLERLETPGFAPHVHLHFDSGPPAQQVDFKAALGTPAPGKHAYVCGPAGFIEAVLGAAEVLGWDAGHVHREYFSAAPIAVAGDAPFQVKLAGTGAVIDIGARQSVVEALAEAGVFVATSCEQGICGTCLTRVIEGVPEHRDSYLTEEERAANDCFLPCCSRALSPLLVLDL
jgi:vanillate O-demethylase ferredoxin subunit